MIKLITGFYLHYVDLASDIDLFLSWSYFSHEENCDNPGVDLKCCGGSCSNKPTPTAGIIYNKPSHTDEHTHTSTASLIPAVYVCEFFKRGFNFLTKYLDWNTQRLGSSLMKQWNSAAAVGAKFKASCQIITLMEFSQSCFRLRSLLTGRVVEIRGAAR